MNTKTDKVMGAAKNRTTVRDSLATGGDALTADSDNLAVDGNGLATGGDNPTTDGNGLAAGSDRQVGHGILAADDNRPTHSDGKALYLAGWLCRLALAVVFLYAGWVKLLAPEAFLEDILNYQLVGGRLAFLLVAVLPPLEIVAGVCLLVKPLAQAAASIVLLLCVVFLGALLSAWGRGLDISCGCFGASDAIASYPLMLLRDLLLIAAAVIALVAMRRTGRGRV